MYSTHEIATFIGAKTKDTKEYRIDWLLTDSRSLCYPETTLFFAIKTEVGNGHRYIADLYQRGVKAFVVSEEVVGDFPDAEFLYVPDTMQALQNLAEHHRSCFNIPVIGIVGSNGKTLVKEWLYQLLAPDFTVTRSPRSYNSQIGVPLSVWGLWEKTEIAVFEAAISEKGEMAALERIVKPTIGIFTCLGTAHQENFSSMEEKCREKLILLKDAEIVIYPAHDETIKKCIQEANLKGKMIPCPSTGNAFEDNKALCRAACKELGLDENTTEERLRCLEPVAMRLEVKDGQNDCTLINDSYNSDLNSLDIALDFMNRRPEKTGRQRTLILSDILQSGVEPHALYTQLAELLDGRGVNNLIAVGGIISAHMDCFIGLPFKCRFFPTTEALLREQTGHDLSIDGVMELGRDLGLVVVEDDIVNIIVTLMLAGVLGDNGLLALFLAGVHDVGHIEGVDMGQPVIDHQQLLGHGLGAGRLHQRQNLVPGGGDGAAIEVHAQHITVGEVLDHAHQVVILVGTGADSLHRHVGQSQHLTQDAQTVLALIVVGQEEGHLDAQHVGVGGPVVQILLVQVQHGADLLGAQGHLLTVIVQDHHGLQLFLHQDDGRIAVVDRALIHLDVAGQVDLQGLGVEDHFVRDDELVVRLLLGAGLCAALVSGAGLAGHGSLCLGGRGHGRHSEHADHHGQDQQQAEETLGHILHCFYLPF